MKELLSNICIELLFKLTLVVLVGISSKGTLVNPAFSRQKWRVMLQLRSGLNSCTPGKESHTLEQYINDQALKYVLQN